MRRKSMYLYDIRYELDHPKGNRRTNTVSNRGRVKEEAITRFRKTHPDEKILETKQIGVLGDASDKKFGELRRNNMPDEKTDKLVGKWQVNRTSFERSKKNLNASAVILEKAASKLGSWLVPDNAQVGEIFNIWISGNFLMIKVLAGKNNYNISYRSEEEALEKDNDIQ